LILILVVRISNADKNNLIISNSLSSVMPLSSYRMHRIYLAATMNYGLGSDDPEELAYYNKIRKDMNDMKKDPIKKGIILNWNMSEDIEK